MCLLETLDQLPELHLLDLVRDPPEFEPVHVQRLLYEEKFGCSLGYHIRLKGGVFGVAEHSCDVFEFLISHSEVQRVLESVLVSESDIQELLSHFVYFFGPTSHVSSCHSILGALCRDIVVVADGEFLWKVQVDDVDCRILLFNECEFSGIEVLGSPKVFRDRHMDWHYFVVLVEDMAGAIDVFQVTA